MRPSNLVKMSLLALIVLVFLIPGAAALNNSYTVPATPGASCWAAQTGSFFDSTYYISLTRPETGVYTGLVFQGINISQGDLINNATLSLYFDISFDSGSSQATLYGFNEPLGAAFYTYSGQLINSPLTSSLVNMNMTGYAAPGWRTFNVTSIVQEIINRPYWNISDNFGFIILGAPGQVHRTITSNIAYPSQWAQLNLTWEEYPGENQTQYRGYTITPDPGDFDLSEYRYQLQGTLVVQGGVTIHVEDMDSYDSVYIEPDGTYFEPFVNFTSQPEPGTGTTFTQTKLYQATMYNGVNDVSRTDVNNYDNYTSPVSTIHNQRAYLFGIERTFGTALGSNSIMAIVCSISDDYSGSYSNRVTNNAPLVGMAIRDYNSTHVKPSITWAVLSSTQSYDQTLPTYLPEGYVYAVKFGLWSFNDYWLGSYYQYIYSTYWYLINESSGEFTYLGRYNMQFNASTSQMNKLNSFELIECYGAGTTNAYLEFYVSRGVPDFGIGHGGFTVDNLTIPCIEAATTLEEVMACIDDYLGGPDPLDPDPPGWDPDPNDYLTRPKLTFYFMALGLLFIIVPPGYMLYSKRLEVLPVALFLILLGVALLWSMAGI